MALAEYFARTAQSIGQAVRSVDRRTLEDTLQQKTVAVVFDDIGLRHPNGAVTAELAVSLMARLYPRLTVRYRGEADRGRQLEQQLRSHAIAVNPVIEIVENSVGKVDSAICVGNSINVAEHCVWVKSDSWNVEVSLVDPIGDFEGAVANPFSAGAAACLAAAEVFGHIFDTESPARRSRHLVVSLLDFELRRSESESLPPVNFEDVVIVGLGAVGNSLIWSLQNVPTLSGKLTLVDPERVDLSNLQRYVLSTRQSVASVKVDLAKSQLNRPGLIVEAYPLPFGQYLERHRPNSDISTLVVAVDTGYDRVSAQAVLPKLVLNGWTAEHGMLGISRHHFLGDQACLACLYLPKRNRASRTEEIAQITGLPHNDVANRVVKQVPMDRELLQEISRTKGYDLELLLPWQGRTLDEFYVHAVCGGALIEVGADFAKREAVVPLAHQSALAGILLGCELVKHALGLTPARFPVMTQLSVLGALPTHLCERRAKTVHPRCICQDPDYLAVYRQKYEFE